MRSLSKSMRANVTLSLPRLSFRNFIPASPWKSGNAALGKFRAWPLAAFRTLWTLNPSSCLDPWAPSLLCWSALPRRVLRFSGPCLLQGVRLCLFSAVSRARFLALAMSRAESLRRLAAQLSSLATLEGAVAHDVQELVVPLASPRAPPTPLALPLSVAQGRSQSSSRLHLAQSARSHGAVR